MLAIENGTSSGQCGLTGLSSVGETQVARPTTWDWVLFWIVVPVSVFGIAGGLYLILIHGPFGVGAYSLAEVCCRRREQLRVGIRQVATVLAMPRPVGDWGTVGGVSFVRSRKTRRCQVGTPSLVPPGSPDADRRFETRRLPGGRASRLVFKLLGAFLWPESWQRSMTLGRYWANSCSTCSGHTGRVRA